MFEAPDAVCAAAGEAASAAAGLVAGVSAIGSASEAGMFADDDVVRAAAEAAAASRSIARGQAGDGTASGAGGMNGGGAAVLDGESDITGNAGTSTACVGGLFPSSSACLRCGPRRLEDDVERFRFRFRAPPPPPPRRYALNHPGETLANIAIGATAEALSPGSLRQIETCDAARTTSVEQSMARGAFGGDGAAGVAAGLGEVRRIEWRESRGKNLARLRNEDEEERSTARRGGGARGEA